MTPRTNQPQTGSGDQPWTGSEDQPQARSGDQPWIGSRDQPHRGTTYRRTHEVWRSTPDETRGPTSDGSGANHVEVQHIDEPTLDEVWGLTPDVVRRPGNRPRTRSGANLVEVRHIDEHTLDDAQRPTLDRVQGPTSSRYDTSTNLFQTMPRDRPWIGSRG